MHTPLILKETTINSYTILKDFENTKALQTLTATDSLLGRSSSISTRDIDRFENQFYQLREGHTDAFLNISNGLLEDMLWPSLQPENWRNEAVKLMAQPVYVVMLALCLFALFMNIISITAIFHIKNKLTTHLRLIISLGSADIMIILSVFLHITNRIFNTPMKFAVTTPNDRLTCACVSATINSINVFAFLISLLNLQAMAVDHYIGIIHPLCYRRHLMSRKKVYVLIIIVWVLAIVGGFSNFLLGYPGYKSKQQIFNYCEYIMYDNFHAEYLVFGVTIISLFVIVFIYSRIYIEVKRIQIRTPSFPDETIHNRKAMVTTLLIIGSFSVCWVPNCIFQLFMIVKIHFDNVHVHKLFNTYLSISKYLYILILTNCLFDPIIYAVRLQTVQKGYKNFLQKLVLTYHSIKTGECLRKCRRINMNRRRPTTTSEYELATLLRQRPTLAQQFSSESADTAEIIQPSAKDVNENKFEADAICHTVCEVERNGKSVQESVTQLCQQMDSS